MLILGFAVRELIKEGVPEHAIAMHGTKVMVDEVARTFGAKSEIRSGFSMKLTDSHLLDLPE